MIKLRSFTTNDFDLLKKWIDSEKFCCQWSAKNFNYPLDDEQLTKYLDSTTNSDIDFAFIGLSEKNVPIGHIKLGKIDYSKGYGYLQFILISSKLRGKGYGKELVNQALNYGFNKLNLEKIGLRVFGFNKAAINCYKSIGFDEIDYSENSFEYTKDEYWDVSYLEITKNFWVEKNSAIII